MSYYKHKKTGEVVVVCVFDKKRSRGRGGRRQGNACWNRDEEMTKQKALDFLLKKVPEERRFEVWAKIELLLSGKEQKEFAYELGVQPQELSSCINVHRYPALRQRITDYFTASPRRTPGKRDN